MLPEDVRHQLRQQPFGPFRLVTSDGEGFDIRHPDLLWVGQWSAMVGLTGDTGKTLYERSVKIDLDHVIRLEPLASATSPPKNGSS
jgi:hypothetical protein